MEEERIDIGYLRKDGWSLASRFLMPSILLSPKVTDFNSLKRMGFVNIFLYDYTEGQQQYYKNSILLIFQPSYSFYNESWEEFYETMASYKNFVKFIDYKGMRYGFWYSISPTFGNNLRWLFKKGFYSEFPKNYLPYLNETERKISLRDSHYQRGMEMKLGLEEGDLDGVELASLADKEDYCIDLTIKDGQ